MIRSIVSVVCMLSLLAQPASAIAQIITPSASSAPQPFPTMAPWNTPGGWSAAPRPLATQTPVPPGIASPNQYGAESAEKWFARVRLGERVESVTSNLGSPNAVAHQAGSDYLAYDIADGKGFFVVRVTGYVVDGKQMTNVMRNYAPVKDELGVALGDTAARARSLTGSLGQNRSSLLRLGRAPMVVGSGRIGSPVAASGLRSTAQTNASNDQLAVWRFASSNGETRFYAFDRFGRVDRFGVSQNSTDLPAMLRWHNRTGWAPSLAVPFSEKTATEQGRKEYVGRLGATPHFECYGGNHLHTVSSRMVHTGSGDLLRVIAECGYTKFRMPVYFETFAGDRHVKEMHLTPPLSALVWSKIRENQPDDSAQPTASRLRLLPAGAPSEPLLMSPAGNNQQPSPTPSPLSGYAIWFVAAPWGVYNPNPSTGTTEFDTAFASESNPSDPFVSFTLTEVGVPNTSPVAGSMARRRTNALTPALTPAANLAPCGYDANGNGKCATSLTPSTASGQPGPHCYQMVGVTQNNESVSSADPMCITITPEAADNPQHNDNKPSCDTCSDVGDPVDVVSGAVNYSYSDGHFSGPFGLQSVRRYSSVRATEQDLLGVGWRTAYSESLNLVNIKAGLVTLESPSGGYSYFGGMQKGSSNYDNYSGSTLTENSDGTFTYTLWSGQFATFNSKGQLSSLSDRYGNVQTIARNTKGVITTVTDPLGRTLTFSVDSSNRITKVTHSTAGVVATFTYDSGTNCYTGDLCTAKEADGGVWTYEYYNPSSYGGNHLLMSVINPNGNVEEQNQYSLISLEANSTYDTHYRVTQQQRQGGADVHKLTYGNFSDGTCAGYAGWTTYAGNHTDDTDGLGRYSCYGWDGVSQQVSMTSGVQNHGLALYNFYHDWFGRPTEFINNGTPAILYSYGRDNIITNPDGSQYIQVAVRGASEIDMPAVAGSSGTITVSKTYQYYPTGDPRQDLVSQESETSVGGSGATATTSFTYSTNGLLTQVTRNGYSNGSPISTTKSFTYDARGRLLTAIGPRTDVVQKTTLTYFSDSDADTKRRGQLASVTDALGHVTSFASAAAPYDTYTAYGAPASATDPNGVTMERTFDAMGRVLSSTMVGVGTTVLAYNPLGNVTKVTKPLGNSLEIGYTPQEKLQSTILADASGAQHEQAAITYNSMDDVKTKTLSSCTSPATSCSAWSAAAFTDTKSYNTVGQLTSDVDGNGVTQSFSYSDNMPAQYTLGNLTETFAFDPLQVTNSYTIDGVAGTHAHDAQYNVSGLTYGGFFSDSLAHDDLGRVTQESSNYFGQTAYQYDAAGDPTSISYADGSSVIAAYDALDRITTATYSKPGTPTETISYSYDDTTPGHFGIGRLSQVTDPSGQTSFTFDPHGLLATKSQVVNGATYAYRYTYDQDARMTALTLASGATIGYSYDYADRPTTVTIGGSTLASGATYAPFGPMTALQYGNGVSQSWTYDQAYRLINAVVANSAATLSSLSYAYNYAGAGLLETITDKLNSGYSRSLGHNFLMLTSDNTGSKLWGTGSFSNWKPYEGLASYSLGSSSGTLTYGSGSALPTSIQTSASGTLPVTVDAVGNAMAIGANTYTYSAREKLVSGEGISYQYDAFGHRVVASGTQGTRTSLYANGHLAEESGLSGSQPAYDYVWIGDKPIAQIAGSTTYYMADNHLSAPYMLTDGGGNVAWQADYTPFGSIYALRTADLHQPLRLPGQEAEEFAVGNPNGASSLYYGGARWYAPAYGFYTQPDPLQDATNLYAYAMLDPTTITDPSGEVPCIFNPFAQFGGSGSAGLSWTSSIFAGLQGPLGDLSAGAGVSYGLGLFPSGWGYFASKGEFAKAAPPGGNACGATTGDPGQNSDPVSKGGTGVIGASLGTGVGAWFSNAEAPSQLKGTFQTYEINTPFISLSCAYSGNVSIDTFTLGPTLGVSGVSYTTNTGVYGP